jgi:hypothetical protein
MLSEEATHFIVIWLEAVNRRTDITMAKRKRTKGQTMMHKTLHRKLKIGKNETH